MTDTIDDAKLLKLQKLLKQRKKKVPASVTVSEEVLESWDLIIPAKQRSRLVELLLRRELRHRIRTARAKRDLAILNQRAEKLASETDDLLRLQADPFE